jgi:hypothetical protein
MATTNFCAAPSLRSGHALSSNITIEETSLALPVN